MTTKLKKQPEMEMKKTGFERFFDWLAILAFVTVMVYLLVQWPSLPNEIPIHFGSGGEPDRWGPGWMIFLLPMIGAVLWIGMYFLEKNPHMHNYLNLTEHNIRQQYRNSQLFVNVMKNEVLIFLSLFTWLSVEVANGELNSLGLSFPLFVVLLLGSICFFIIRSLRL